MDRKIIFLWLTFHGLVEVSELRKTVESILYGFLRQKGLFRGFFCDRSVVVDAKSCSETIPKQLKFAQLSMLTVIGLVLQALFLGSGRGEAMVSVVASTTMRVSGEIMMQMFG